jgi:hypothetical protein
MPLDQLRRRAGLTAGKFFYGVHGTPFVDAANAWWWTLDCLDARAEGMRATASLRIGRPCEPDDVVNAMRRLDLPALHAKTVMSWGRQRTEPPEGSEARRLWDEVMERLTRVLQARGIVRSEPAGPLALMDVPLTGLRPIGAGIEDALEKLGAAVTERERRVG